MGTKPLTAFNLASIKPAVLIRMFGSTEKVFLQWKHTNWVEINKSHYPARLLLLQEFESDCFITPTWLCSPSLRNLVIYDANSRFCRSNFDVIIATLCWQWLIFHSVHAFFSALHGTAEKSSDWTPNRTCTPSAHVQFGKRDPCLLKKWTDLIWLTRKTLCHIVVCDCQRNQHKSGMKLIQPPEFFRQIQPHLGNTSEMYKQVWLRFN